MSEAKTDGRLADKDIRVEEGPARDYLVPVRGVVTFDEKGTADKLLLERDPKLRQFMQRNLRDAVRRKVQVAVHGDVVQLRRELLEFRRWMLLCISPDIWGPGGPEERLKPLDQVIADLF